MLRQRDAESAPVLHGPAHEQFVLHAVAVVGEDPHSRGGEFGERGECLSATSDGDATAGHDLDESGPATLFAHEVDDGDAVLRGIGVRHRDDRGVAALRRGTTPGLDRLRFFLARLAQVRVQVDEARCDDAAGHVDDVIARCRRHRVGDLDDATLAQHDVGATILRAVDHPSTGEDDATAHHATSPSVALDDSPTRRS